MNISEIHFVFLLCFFRWINSHWMSFMCASKFCDNALFANNYGWYKSWIRTISATLKRLFHIFYQMTSMKWMRLKLIIFERNYVSFTLAECECERSGHRPDALDCKKRLHGNGMHGACFSAGLHIDDRPHNFLSVFTATRISFFFPFLSAYLSISHSVSHCVCAAAHTLTLFVDSKTIKYSYRLAISLFHSFDPRIGWNMLCIKCPLWLGVEMPTRFQYTYTTPIQ